MTHHYHAMGPVQLGDVATWVGGAATAVALVLTWALLVITRREQRSKETDQRQAQAHRVSGWSDRSEQIGDTAVHAITVAVQNASNEPVYGVRAAVGAAWFGDPIRYKELKLRRVLPPKCDHQETVELPLHRSAAGGYEPAPPVELIFRDAAGRYWHRHRNGELTEITKDLPPSGQTYFFTGDGQG
jgi:hypothetical protein